MLFQAGQVWGYVVRGIYSNACYIIRSCHKKKKKKPPPNTSVYINYLI